MVSQADRLARIEEKIDKLSEVLVTLARAEEKIYGLQDDHNKMFDRVNKIQERVDSIELKVESLEIVELKYKVGIKYYYQINLM